jgi:hypothetical protein
MAVFLNNGVVLTVDNVDLSDKVTAVTINRAFDELEVTAMGDSGHKFVKGLEASSITIDFLNDTAAGETLVTLQNSYGKNIVVTAKQTSAAVSASNPLYTMTCLVNNLTDIAGSVSEIGMQSVTWTVSGTVAITTAP